jgi:hypothetical protein
MRAQITHRAGRWPTHRPGVAAVLAVLIAASNLAGVRAQTPPLPQTAVLMAPDGAHGDGFGSTVAIASDGKTAVVGAPGKMVHGVAQSGVVYFYVRGDTGSWSKQAELHDPNPGRSPGTGSAFGSAVALSADATVALVGAPKACDPASCTPTQSSQEGAVYVYSRRSGRWTRTATLSDPRRALGDAFGQVLALSGDGRRAIVGAPGVQAQNGAAAAYFYRQVGGRWLPNGQANAPAPGADKRMSFGSSVALSADGTLAIIGARHTDGAAPNQGAAYIWHYHKGVWRRTATMYASDAARDLEFGFAVAVQRTSTGPVALIGSPGVAEPCPCGNPTNSAGAVYVFASQNGTWTQTTKISDPADTSWDDFGDSVALTPDGRYAAISAATTYWWTAPVATGRTYLFAQNGGTWTMAQQFLNPNQGERDFFGTDVTLDAAGKTVLISAAGYPGDTATNADQGAVYVNG